MLQPSELKPFLLHADAYVRDAVANYLYDGWCGDEEAASLILEAAARDGLEENILGIRALSRIPLSGGSIEAILELLQRSDHSAVRHWLNRALVSAPLGRLMEMEGKILQNLKVSDKSRDVISRRKGWAAREPSSLWGDLASLAAEIDPHSSPRVEVLVRADSLIETLAASGYPPPSALLVLLTPGESSLGWLGAFFLRLAGAQRLREAIPILVERLRGEDDLETQWAGEALARIGDAEGALRIGAAYGNTPDPERPPLVEALACLKLPIAEETLLRLLPGERDPFNRSYLAKSLLRLFSREGLDRALAVIKEGDDFNFIDLQDSVLPVADVLGIDLPDAAAWKEERKVQESENLKQAEIIDRLARSTGDDEDGDEEEEDFDLDEDSIDEGYLGDDEDPGGEIIEPPAGTFVREEPKVGRNDPCPCGSGKKYKKCCGKG